MSSTATSTTAVDAASAPVSSLPSGEPIDSSSSAAAAASSTPKPKKSSSSAPSAASTAATLDALIVRLHRCVQTRAGNDTVLLFLTYLFRLTGATLETLSRSALRHSARQLVALAVQLPPSTSVAVAETPAVAPAAAAALRLAVRFKALSALLSDVRTFGRLWGLLGLYFAGKKLLAAPSTQDAEKVNASEARFDKTLAAVQLIALVSYQAAENVAFLASKKVLPVHPATQGKLARWSVRSWATYVGMELGRMLIVRQRRVAAAGGRLTAAKDGQWSAEWKRDFFRNLAWAPLTIHWSVDNPPLSELAVSLLAFYPSFGQMKDLWLSSA